LGRPEEVVSRAAQAAAEEQRGDAVWAQRVREALRKLGKGEGYALAIARNRGLAHLGSLEGITQAEALLILRPLEGQIRRAAGGDVAAKSRQVRV
jgi:hypothetical protein